MVLPCLGSDRIYVVDTGKNPRSPQITKVMFIIINENCASHFKKEVITKLFK